MRHGTSYYLLMFQPALTFIERISMIPSRVSGNNYFVSQFAKVNLKETNPYCHEGNKGIQ